MTLAPARRTRTSRRRRGRAQLARLAFMLALVGAAGVSRSAQASSWPDDQDQAHPCRPTVSCTADIVAPGAFEVEIGGVTSTAKQGHVASFPLLLKQTLTKLVQLQVGSNGYSVVTGSSPVSQLRYVDNVFFRFRRCNPSVSRSRGTTSRTPLRWPLTTEESVLQ